jgi:hypothetical protein
MASSTRRALEDFDNQHDFERLAADVLNALGYKNVEPMAPAGGADGGIDIKFRDGDEDGRAFVTLEKKIRDKFARDLEAQQPSSGVIMLFCTVDVSPTAKFAFAKDALAKGFRLDVYDVERLRSLLDASLKELRRRYLDIDDDVAAVIRSRVKKLLRFPDAVESSFRPKTTLESLFIDHTPARMFELLMEYDEDVVAEVPGVGAALHQHLLAYYELRQQLAKCEERILARIGETASSRMYDQWCLQLQYNILRAGRTADDLARGENFLNYGMTWESAERGYARHSDDEEVQGLVNRVFERYSKVCDLVGVVAAALSLPWSPRTETYET